LGRDYEAIEKLAKLLITQNSESELRDLLPKNTRILVFDQDTKTLVIQEEDSPGACYVLFKSEIAPTSHRFGSIVMSDSFSYPTTTGGWQIWESATIAKKSDERIEILLHRLDDNEKIDTVIAVRSDPKLNSIWKFDLIGPGRPD
jgi:hypothetical protein